MSKIGLLYYGLLTFILFKWIFAPEDIVGTRELAVLLVFMLWYGMRHENE